MIPKAFRVGPDERLEDLLKVYVAECAAADRSAAVMKDAPGTRLGVVLPLLRALAHGPVNLPEPHDVDGLLTHAASVFRKGYLAQQIASDRRGRAADDPGATGADRPR